jgi:DNA polymerase epsilon subunit 1
MKAENLRSHCDCSGEYNMTETRQDLVRRLQVTANVAAFHKLETLTSAVDWLRLTMV